MNKHKREKARKLSLSKETLRILEEDLLREIVGGATYGTCNTEVTRQASNCNCSDDTCYASCS